MCFHVASNIPKSDIKIIFDAEYVGPHYDGSNFINGFSFPKVPIIMDESKTEAILGDWGLIPFWAKDRNIQKATLNGRIETLDEKPNFKNSINKRCLVLVNGFYEWKWLDPKGKDKQRYFIQLDSDDKAFALGGIYNQWIDKTTGEELTSFSIVTTDANDLMADIHNTKHRMPIILSKQARDAWLSDINYKEFAYPNYNPKLRARVM